MTSKSNQIKLSFMLQDPQCNFEFIVFLINAKFEFCRFVSDKMGGPVIKEDVPNFSFELPISQLKHDLNSNVIPIGLIKTGIYYHRGLLFKVSWVQRSLQKLF